MSRSPSRTSTTPKAGCNRGPRKGDPTPSGISAFAVTSAGRPRTLRGMGPALHSSASTRTHSNQRPLLITTFTRKSSIEVGMVPCMTRVTRVPRQEPLIGVPGCPAAPRIPCWAIPRCELSLRAGMPARGEDLLVGPLISGDARSSSRTRVHGSEQGHTSCPQRTSPRETSAPLAAGHHAYFYAGASGKWSDKQAPLSGMRPGRRGTVECEPLPSRGDRRSKAVSKAARSNAGRLSARPCVATTSHRSPPAWRRPCPAL